MRRKIAVFGHCGTFNLGDEALLVALIQNVRLRWPDAEIIGFTINPADTHQRHNIPAFPLRQIGKISPPPPASSPESVIVNKASEESSPSSFVKILKGIPGLRPFVSFLRKSAGAARTIFAEPKFLLDSYHALRGVDLLLIAGSQQLNDFNGGAFGFPYTLYKWSLLAKLRGIKVAFMSVGAGPLDTWMGKMLARKALCLASYHSYRGESAVKLINQLNVPGENFAAPDLVYSLQVPPAAPQSSGAAKTPVIGLNPVPYFDARYWPQSDAKVYEEYVQTLSDFAIWVAGRGNNVIIFPTQLRADPRVVRDMERVIKSQAPPDLLPRIQSRIIDDLHDLIATIGTMDILVASRFHGIVIPLVLHKPVLGIAYHRKTRDLMELMGQGDFVLDIHPLSLKDLQQTFLALESNKQASVEEITRRTATARLALDKQYETVFGLIENARLPETKNEVLRARS